MAAETDRQPIPDPRSYDAAITRAADPKRAKNVRMTGWRQFMARAEQIVTEDEPR